MTKKMYYNILLSMTTLYYALCFISDSLPGGQLLAIIPLSVMLFLHFRKNGFNVKLYAVVFSLYLIVFIAFCMLSRLWAQNSMLAVPKINSLIFILIAMVVIIICIYEFRDVNILLKTVMYGGYILCLYIFLRYGWSGITRLLRSNTRISSEFLNSNTIGMCVSYALVINIYYIINDGIKWKDAMMIPAVILIIVSGSRKAIGIIAIGALGVILLKNMDNRDVVKTTLKVLLCIILFSGLVLLLSKLPAFENITNRILNLFSLLQGNEIRSTSDAWIRLAYIRLGMDLFKSHPIKGIGIANANIYTNMYYGHNHYLHNNYVELLACGGITGFMLYYSMWLYLVFIFIKYRKRRDSIYDICLVLLIIHLIMDYGAVSYYSKETYIFLLLFWIEAKQLQGRRKRSLALR